ncbi:MAG TPA: hypothetical protein VMO26_18725 [Vicinamibacterales bacterium]|nr:hypothetical protein [Vicinamibacterales bacterium]
MSNPKRPPLPRGPEGVPVDAPDNDAPAVSPHAVSRMHRAENDREAIEHSPEFSDRHNITNEDRREQERWLPGSPGSGRPDDASRGLDGEDTKRGEINPSHDTHKAPEERPRGVGDGELMEQPDSESEAREPGADTPQFDK